jgi:hypothetical protein
VEAVTDDLGHLVIPVAHDGFLQHQHIGVEPLEPARDGRPPTWPVHVVPEQVLRDHSHALKSCASPADLHDKTLPKVKITLRVSSTTKLLKLD